MITQSEIFHQKQRDLIKKLFFIIDFLLRGWLLAWPKGRGSGELNLIYPKPNKKMKKAILQTVWSVNVNQ